MKKNITTSWNKYCNTIFYLCLFIGKLRNFRGSNDLERVPQKYRVTDPYIMTQGDRLNEIKMNRFKSSRNSESRQKNCISHGLDALKNARRRK